MSAKQGATIQITGIVQGVGFRPFVYNLAARLNLHGSVRNSTQGVEIELDGAEQAIQEFTRLVLAEAPPLAYIEQMRIERRPVHASPIFEILASHSIPGTFQPVSPDIGICDDCQRELFDPADRRYLYPFINCTNCGPRFTIIQDIPYDRPNTTMAGFRMCPTCQAEYEDPGNRRFHAQPIACPSCGPQVWLVSPQGQLLAERQAAITAAKLALQAGQIVAIKGLGGFHLACDAANPDAILELRRRKLRVDKPFAVMVRDVLTAQAEIELGIDGTTHIQSVQRPIVVASRKPTGVISAQVSPGQSTIGIMLPYTPLHCLLFNDGPLSCLVMTSGNLSEEPIAIENSEAIERLTGLADVFLLHDRPIHMRCDDSVLRAAENGKTGTAQKAISIRRARGYAPFPIRLPFPTSPLLAAGSELKNTFCLARDTSAFTSQHIGDMENLETYRSYEAGIAHFEKLFRIKPQLVAHDLHPDYLATRYARERAEREGIPAFAIQHHHAHIAACMAEHGLDAQAQVIGIAFDGTGLGSDGAIWGGEFLIASYQTFQRAAHLAYYPLPGGDAAIRKPARTALAYLWQAGVDWEPNLPCVSALCAEERSVLRAQLTHRINTPNTSSVGRAFDAIASICGVRHSINYEAQAAIEFESLADPQELQSYRWELNFGPTGWPMMLDPQPVIQQTAFDTLAGVAIQKISARFHLGLVQAVVDTCLEIRSEWQISEVVLSGGVWQNMRLLLASRDALERCGFTVYTHARLPSNDGGVSLGQAVIAAASIQEM